MIHDISPFVWKISGEFGIRWYGVSYILALFTVYIVMVWISRRQKSGLTVNMVVDIVAYSAIGILLGGRLGYCLFYSPDLFIKFKSDFPFWGVLALHEGGMSSHGGIVGVIIALTMYAWRARLSQLYLYDLGAIGGSVGFFFGRIANFINGELVGRPVDASFPLAVKFPQDILFWPEYDIPKLSRLAQVADKVPGLDRVSWLEWVDKFRIDPMAREKIDVGISKIIEAVQSGNVAVKESLAPLLESRHPAQIYAAFGEGLFIFLFLVILWYRPRKPGILMSWFLFLYSLISLIEEQFRMPDPQLGFGLLGFTRGQWLSTVMLLTSFWFLLLFGRREALPAPGWNLGQNVRIHRRY